jgi:electron-transferring-flavoprotein dehydrogenase
VLHSVGWPLDSRTYGGSFAYHDKNNRLLIGLVTGLDYANPFFDPYEEFQRLKTHPLFRHLLQGAKRIAYGARALNEGGWQSLPELVMPGGALIGCAAGFLNVPKIKGSHLAMKSGMLAAEAVAKAMESGKPPLLSEYPESFKHSWAGQELYRVRNIRPGFHWGLYGGFALAALDTYLMCGRAPWTLAHGLPDHKKLKSAALCQKKDYPKPDGTLTFDRMSSVYLSNTAHEENQPVHLTLKDASIPANYNLPNFAAPEQRYCPAGVYEIVESGGNASLRINAANCVHCKTCDIKDPLQNIVWTVPEGGGGPNYADM